MSVAPDPDTAARSLAHWSEAGRAEMEAFYALARRDYEQLAGALDWGRLLADVPTTGGLELLDVACGSGKFPEALERHADLSALAGKQVAYDLLDPSAFSLEEAAGMLRPPFVARERFQTTIEELDGAAGPWDVVWATHALYALQPALVPAAVSRLLTARAPHGLGVLAQGSRDGHYLRVYDAFLSGVRGGSGTPYVASEDLVAELRAQGAQPEVRRLRYDHVIDARDTATLEGYLQRCLFDDDLALPELLAAPVLGPYLQGTFDADAGVHRFHHEVDLVVLAPAGTTLPWLPAS